MVFLVLFGLFVWLAPFVFVGLAWAWLRKNSDSLVEWRRSFFSVAVVGAGINSSLIVALFLLHLSNHGEPDFGTVGRIGVILSVAVFALGLFGAGKARVYVLLATICTFFLWNHNL